MLRTMPERASPMFAIAAPAATPLVCVRSVGRGVAWGSAVAGILLLLSSGASWGDENRRIRRAPPTVEEQQSISAETAKNDSLLRQGDIVVTERGFLVFKGIAADGLTNRFEAIPNPLNASRTKKD